MAAKTMKYGYIDIPNVFFKRGLSASKLLALSSVYSFSSAERERYGYTKKKNSVKFTVSSFASRYNVSASTSRRALASLEGYENIQRTDEGMFFDADKMKDGKADGYLHIEEWLFFATFAGEYLTKSEVMVLARLLSLAKNGATVKASYRYVARGLGLSHTLVMKATDKLERVGVLNILSRGRNKYERTVFVLQKDYLEERKTETRQKTSPKTDEGRVRYYENLQRIAKDRQRAMLQRACKDVIFKENYKKWYDRQTDARLQAILFERLGEMGMSWRDIQLRCVCGKCKDTGTLPNGENCNCYVEKLNK